MARKKVSELEARIHRLEERQAELGRLLTHPDVYKDVPRMNEMLGEFDANRRKIEELMARWELKQQELERIEADNRQRAGES